MPLRIIPFLVRGAYSACMIHSFRLDSFQCFRSLIRLRDTFARIIRFVVALAKRALRQTVPHPTIASPDADTLDGFAIGCVSLDARQYLFTEYGYPAAIGPGHAMARSEFDVYPVGLDLERYDCTRLDAELVNASHCLAPCNSLLCPQARSTIPKDSGRHVPDR